MPTPKTSWDLKRFRQMVGNLLYLTITWPDLRYPVYLISQYMAHPVMEHLKCACIEICLRQKGQVVIVSGRDSQTTYQKKFACSDRSADCPYFTKPLNLDKMRNFSCAMPQHVKLDAEEWEEWIREGWPQTQTPRCNLKLSLTGSVERLWIRAKSGNESETVNSIEMFDLEKPNLRWVKQTKGSRSRCQDGRNRRIVKCRHRDSEGADKRQGSKQADREGRRESS